MITHAASPKTFLYCFIEPPRLAGLFSMFVEFLLFFEKFLKNDWNWR